MSTVQPGVLSSVGGLPATPITLGTTSSVVSGNQFKVNTQTLKPNITVHHPTAVGLRFPSVEGVETGVVEIEFAFPDNLGAAPIRLRFPDSDMFETFVDDLIRLRLEELPAFALRKAFE